MPTKRSFNVAQCSFSSSGSLPDRSHIRHERSRRQLLTSRRSPAFSPKTQNAAQPQPRTREPEQPPPRRESSGQRHRRVQTAEGEEQHSGEEEPREGEGALQGGRGEGQGPHEGEGRPPQKAGGRVGRAEPPQADVRAPDEPEPPRDHGLVPQHAQPGVRGAPDAEQLRFLTVCDDVSARVYVLTDMWVHMEATC